MVNVGVITPEFTNSCNLHRVQCNRCIILRRGVITLIYLHHLHQNSPIHVILPGVV
jgi:hypothetical protein